MQSQNRTLAINKHLARTVAEDCWVKRGLNISHSMLTRAAACRWTLAVLRPLRWGIAGTGAIANDVVSVLALLPGVQLQAIGARKDKEKAKQFAARHGAIASSIALHISTLKRATQSWRPSGYCRQCIKPDNFCLASAVCVRKRVMC